MLAHKIIAFISYDIGRVLPQRKIYKIRRGNILPCYKIPAFDDTVKISRICPGIVIFLAVFNAHRKLLHNTYIRKHGFVRNIIESKSLLDSVHAEIVCNLSCFESVRSYRTQLLFRNAEGAIKSVIKLIHGRRP